MISDVRIASGRDPKTVEYLKKLDLIGVVGTALIYFAALLTAWGHWQHVGFIVGLFAVVAVLNFSITHHVAPRLGVERAEDLRLIPNLGGIVILGLTTDWSVALFFAPFATALVGGMHTSQARRRTAIILVVVCLGALVGKANWELVVAVAALSLYWQLVVGGHISFAREVLADRQRNLEELKAAQGSAIANEKLASIGLFASGIAHEINNPMSFITSNVKMLMEDLEAEPALPPSFSEYKTEIIPGTLDGIGRVNAIVDDLRRFASGEPERVVSFDLAREVRVAMRMSKSQLRGSQRFTEDFHAAPMLVGLPRQVSQVALNLIVNALQASPDDGEVTIHISAVGEGAIFRVTDRGTGIAPEVLARLFTPFLTTKPAGKGTGLGLAVARQMITAQGGQITVKSELGKGTTFEVSLPQGGDTGAHLKRIQPGVPTMS